MKHLNIIWSKFTEFEFLALWIQYTCKCGIIVCVFLDQIKTLLMCVEKWIPFAQNFKQKNGF